MNALTDSLPTAVRIAGAAVPINTDFRVAIKIMSAFADIELTEPEKLEVMVRLLYPKPPRDAAAAVKQGLKFLNIGAAPEPPPEPAVYNFEKDSKYIYTAFRSTYNIDLETVEHMHWWKFRALFSDLGECFFTHLVGIRSRMHTGELLASEKKYVAKNKDVIYLDDRGGTTAAKDFIAGIGKPKED